MGVDEPFEKTTLEPDATKSSGIFWKQASVTLTPGVYSQSRYE